jgi:plastocyanin
MCLFSTAMNIFKNIMFNHSKYKHLIIMKRLIGSKSRVLIGAGFFLAILSIVTSCSKNTDNTPGPGPGGPGTNEVWIKGMAFTPAIITVKAGTTIKWTNKDPATHTVTSDPGDSESFESGSMGNGAIWSYQFNNVGTLPYHCAVHTGMKASVIVN